MTAPVPSPDLREALRLAERYRRGRMGMGGGIRPDAEFVAITLADEIYRLRAELASEGERRIALAATLESDWAEQCNAMAPVVRAAVAWERSANPISEELTLAVRVFRATGLLPDIELEDSK